jgi:hypothetical protein
LFWYFCISAWKCNSARWKKQKRKFERETSLLQNECCSYITQESTASNNVQKYDTIRRNAQAFEFRSAPFQEAPEMSEASICSLMAVVVD